MIVIVVTGSISSGKSTVLQWIKELRIPVDDADAHVHEMFIKNTAVIKRIKELWPESIEKETVNREKLRECVLGNPQAMKQLEQITHPVVRHMSKKFLEACKKNNEPVVFLDIPLFFESPNKPICDSVLVVYCSPETQRQRALNRGTSLDTFEYFNQRQTPLDIKLSKADFILNTDGTLDQTKQNLIEVLHQIENRYQIKFIKG
ncbi:MAG: dephospho-CoA kinase [Alphaproteobacteria bacterium]|nr:dephospho-CoA kinase [Alphaproteobacteria bacterium]